MIQNIINLKPKSKYILAVDESKNTLEDIVKVSYGSIRKVIHLLGIKKIKNTLMQADFNPACARRMSKHNWLKTITQ